MEGGAGPRGRGRGLEPNRAGGAGPRAGLGVQSGRGMGQTGRPGGARAGGRWAGLAEGRGPQSSLTPSLQPRARSAGGAAASAKLRGAGTSWAREFLKREPRRGLQGQEGPALPAAHCVGPGQTSLQGGMTVSTWACPGVCTAGPSVTPGPALPDVGFAATCRLPEGSPEVHLNTRAREAHQGLSVPICAWGDDGGDTTLLAACPGRPNLGVVHICGRVCTHRGA